MQFFVICPAHLLVCTDTCMWRRTHSQDYGCIQNHILLYYILYKKQYVTKEECPPITTLTVHPIFMHRCLFCLIVSHHSASALDAWTP